MEVMIKKMTSSSENKTSSKPDDHDEEVVLPGFRFHPTDEELVGFYLRRKVEKKPISIELIKQIDIYKYDPWDLPKVSTMGDKEWYFFCLRGRKYRNSVRPNRVTGSGFWKATGIDKPIYSVKDQPLHHHLHQPHHQCIGLKKSLVYYRGSAGKGTKTDWMMHEFRLPPAPNAKPTDLFSNAKDATTTQQLEAEVWTICRIFKRIPSYKKYIPDWKEVTGTAITSRTSPRPTDSSSITCSLESDYSCEAPQRSLEDSVLQRIERKPDVEQVVVDEQNRWYLGQFNHPLVHQPPFTASHPSNLNTSSTNGAGDDVFTTGNWDELRSVVQLAIHDPSQVYYDCA